MSPTSSPTFPFVQTHLTYERLLASGRRWFWCRHCGGAFIGGPVEDQPVTEERDAVFDHEATCQSRPSIDVDAAAQTLRGALAADEPMPWDEISEDRREIWRARAAAVLGAGLCGVPVTAECLARCEAREEWGMAGHTWPDGKEMPDYWRESRHEAVAGIAARRARGGWPEETLHLVRRRIITTPALQDESR